MEDESNKSKELDLLDFSTKQHNQQLQHQRNIYKIWPTTNRPTDSVEFRKLCQIWTTFVRHNVRN